MATLNNLNHTFAPDVDVLLVGPLGQKVILMGSAGGASGAANANVTFSDTAAQFVPQNSQIGSGSYRPANPILLHSRRLRPRRPMAPIFGLRESGSERHRSLYIVGSRHRRRRYVASGWSLGISIITPVNKHC